MSSLQSIFTQAYPPVLKDYYDSLWQSRLLDSSNTFAVVRSTVINTTGLSGVVYFTGISIVEPGYTNFTLNNSYSTTSKSCLIILLDSDQSNGNAVLGWVKCLNGSIVVRIGAIGADEIEVKFSYQFLN